MQLLLAVRVELFGPVIIVPSSHTATFDAMFEDNLIVCRALVCCTVALYHAAANCTSSLVNEVCYSDDGEHENKWCVRAPEVSDFALHSVLQL